MTDRKRWVIWLALFGFFVSSCGIAGSFRTRTDGDRYLDRKDYETGLKDFGARALERPDDPRIFYYQGRFLLALDRPEEALPLLKRAISLRPDEPDYHFWLGVTHWALLDFADEAGSYRKALGLNPRHVPAHVYLGHNYLDQGRNSAALEEYDAALKLVPTQPEALYNRALALGRLGREAEAMKARKDYLNQYPDGPFAREVAYALNAMGDFTYRNHQIGSRLVTLSWIKFKPGTDVLDPEAIPSLGVLGSTMEVAKDLRVSIESYYRDNEALARSRAQAIKNHIIGRFPGVDQSRFTMRYYGRPESVAAGKKLFSLDSSIVFKTVTQ